MSRSPRVKILSVADGERYNINGYPSFHRTGSIAGMRRQFYGQNALLVRCGSYIYNVTTAPHIYDAAH